MATCSTCGAEVPDASEDVTTCPLCRSEQRASREGGADPAGPPAPGVRTVSFADLLGPKGEAPSSSVDAGPSAEGAGPTSEAVSKVGGDSGPGSAPVPTREGDTPERDGPARGGETSRDDALPPKGTTSLTSLASREGLANDAMVSQYWSGCRPSKSTAKATLRPVHDEYVASPRVSDLVVPNRTIQQPNEGPSGDYEALSYIDEGAMGEVHRATQSSMQREVALKLLKDGSGYTPEQQTQTKERFLLEAAITGGLEHPNIPPVYDLGVNADGQLFYSMKLIQGAKWESALEAGELTLAESLDIFLKVADAVGYAHSRGIIHRDLKPENVMLGEYGEVLVVDWGLAVNLNADSEFPLAGSPAYIAPEMVTGPCRAIGAHSDIYLLGAILFELRVGAPPHLLADDSREVFELASRNEIVEIPGELKDDPLTKIALRAISTKPRDRYRSVESLSSAIRDYQTHMQSVGVSEEARADLNLAKEQSDSAAFMRSIFGFESALKLWGGNSDASIGLAEAREAFARFSSSVENYEQALDLIDPDDQTLVDLRSDIIARRNERDTRKQRLTFMRRLATVGLTLFTLTVAVAGSLVWVGLGELDARAHTIRQQEIEIGEKKTEADKAKEGAQAALASLGEKERELNALDEVNQGNLKLIGEQRKALNDEKRKFLQQQQLTREAEEAKGQETLKKERAQAQEKVSRYRADVALAALRVADDDTQSAARVLRDKQDIDPGALGWERQRLLWQASIGSRSEAIAAPAGAYDLIASGRRAFATLRYDDETQRSVVRVYGEQAQEPALERSLKTPSNPLCVDIDDNGDWLAVGCESNPPGEAVLMVFDLARGAAEPVLARAFASRGRPEPTRASDLEFDASGATLAIAGRFHDGGESPIRILQREGSAWNEEAEVRLLKAPKNRVYGKRVSLSSDARQLLGIVACLGETVGPVNWWSASADGQWDRACESVDFGAPGCLDIAMRPDSQVIAAAMDDGKVLQWKLPLDKDTKRLAKPLPVVGEYVHRESRPVTRVNYLDDRRLVASGYGRAVLVHEMDPSARAAGGVTSKRLRGHTSSITDSIPLEGQQVLSLDTNGSLRRWDVAGSFDRLPLTRAARVKASTAVALSPNGRVVVTGDSDGRTDFYGGLEAVAASPSRVRYDEAGGHRARSPSLVQLKSLWRGETASLVTLCEGELCVWDPETAVVRSRLTADGVKGLLARPGGSDLVAVKGEKSRLWVSLGPSGELTPLADEAGGNVPRLKSLAFHPKATGFAAVFGTQRELRYYPEPGATPSTIKPRVEGEFLYTPDGGEVILLTPQGLQLLPMGDGGGKPRTLDLPSEPGWGRPAALGGGMLFGAKPGARIPFVAWYGDDRLAAKPRILRGVYSKGDLSPRGKKAVLINEDGEAFLWEGENPPTPIRTPSPWRDAVWVGPNRLARLLKLRGTDRDVIGEILDVADPTRPKLVGRLTSGSAVLGLAVDQQAQTVTGYTACGSTFTWSVPEGASPVVLRQEVLNGGRLERCFAAGQRVWLVNDQGQLRTHPSGNEQALNLELPPGDYVTAGSASGEAFVVDRVNGLRVFTPDGLSAAAPELREATQIAVSSSGDWLSAYRADVGELSLWRRDREANTYQRVADAPGFAGVTALAITPDSAAGSGAWTETSRLIVGDFRGGVTVIQMVAAGGDQPAAAAARYRLEPMFEWIAHKHAIASLSFSRVEGADWLVSTSDHGASVLWPAAPTSSADQITSPAP